MTRGDLSQFERLLRLGPTPAGEAWLGRARNSTDQIRLVVIEALSDSLADRSDLGDELAANAREATGLSHPHLVQTYGAGVEGDDFCLVHAFAFGEPLGELTDIRPKLPVGVALRIATDVASALAYGHGKAGIVHGAIHPMVLFVGPDGRTRLGRFGTEHLVRRARHDLGDLNPEQLSYLSPEHCLDNRLDARTDVFNLGIVLWELLTGRLLYEEEDEFQRMQAICDRRAPPPSQFRDDLPPLVNSLVRKALAIEPGDRFADGAELEEAFTGALRRVGSPADHDVVGEFLAETVPDRIDLWDRLAEATTRGDLDAAVEAAGALMGTDEETDGTDDLDQTDRIPTDVRKSLQEGSVADSEENDRGTAADSTSGRAEEEETTKRQKVDQLEKLRDIASTPIDESEESRDRDDGSDQTVESDREALLEAAAGRSSSEERDVVGAGDSDLETTSELDTADDPTVDEQIDADDMADLLRETDEAEESDAFSETDEVTDASSESALDSASESVSADVVDPSSRKATEESEAVHTETEKREGVGADVGDAPPGDTAPAESGSAAISDEVDAAPAGTDAQSSLEADLDGSDVPEETRPAGDTDTAGDAAVTVDDQPAVGGDDIEARETLPDPDEPATAGVGRAPEPAQTKRRGADAYPDDDITTDDFEPDRPVSEVESPDSRDDSTDRREAEADGTATESDDIAEDVERLSIDDWLDEEEEEPPGERFPLEELVADRHEPEQERVPEPALELLRLGTEGPVDITVLRRGDRWRKEEVPVAVTCGAERATVHLAEPATGWLLRAGGDGRRERLPEPPDDIELAPGDIAEVDDGAVRYRLRYFHPPKAPDHIAAENRTRRFGGYALAAIVAIALHAAAGFGLARLHESTNVAISIDEEPREEKFAKGKLEKPEPDEPDEPEPKPPPEPPEPKEPVDPAEQEPDVPDQVQDEVEEKLQKKQKKAQESTEAEALAQALEGSGNEAESGPSSVEKAVSNIDAVESPSDSSAAKVKGSLDGIEGNEVEIADSDGSSSLEGLGEDIGEGTGKLKGREDKGGEVRGTVSSVDTQADVQGRLSRAKVTKTIDERMGDIQGCYEDQLLENAGLSGKVTLEWTITRSGDVTGAREKSSSLGSAEVSNCILRILRQLKFPKPKGGSVSITYPFVFQSG